MGLKTEWHHPIPKAKRGRAVVPVHPICHRTIHAHFTNAELARLGDDASALRGRAEIARFISWVEDKPPDFYAPTSRAGKNRGRKDRAGKRR